ncbi:3-oxoacyl-ACP reductase family protein [Lentzea albidocapillata]|uniref:3-oxoacyl-[acyl-carrier protein] reductase n=1 Tax=Lentzea albidocapillata TaxID=40571 RepID=A0A1W2FMJ6_9PSEU|nr:3-oxoacyl-ACP reductase family protein [Lentzea albidocapillata]SMD23120.1 3-oxoacyl-[acyl-carrier protein] reductase [Lentzea albidocapillata]
MSKSLAGKVAIVTGGSRGIGAGIAERLAAAGATVAITYYASPEQAELVVKSIGEAGGTAVAIRVDAGDRDAVRAGITEIAERFGRLDVLVNNAGVIDISPVGTVTDADYDRALAVNQTGVFVASQEALRHLGEGGRIITIGSVNADRIPFAGGTVYALTKAAVAGLTRALAREVSGRGITVNTVQPGPVDTDMNPADGPFADSVRTHIAAARYGTADEVGSLVTYLAGPDAAYITGATINVDGGYAA